MGFEYKVFSFHNLYILHLYCHCMEKIRFPAKVVANNRVTIPQNFVEAYGIQQGDNVTVEIELRKESGK